MTSENSEQEKNKEENKKENKEEIKESKNPQQKNPKRVATGKKGVEARKIKAKLRKEEEEN